MGDVNRRFFVLAVAGVVETLGDSSLIMILPLFIAESERGPGTRSVSQKSCSLGGSCRGIALLTNCASLRTANPVRWFHGDPSRS